MSSAIVIGPSGMKVAHTFKLLATTEVLYRYRQFVFCMNWDALRVTSLLKHVSLNKISMYNCFVLSLYHIDSVIRSLILICTTMKHPGHKPRLRTYHILFYIPAGVNV